MFTRGGVGFEKAWVVGGCGWWVGVGGGWTWVAIIVEGCYRIALVDNRSR